MRGEGGRNIVLSDSGNVLSGKNICWSGKKPSPSGKNIVLSSFRITQRQKNISLSGKIISLSDFRQTQRQKILQKIGFLLFSPPEKMAFLPIGSKIATERPTYEYEDHEVA